MVFWGESQTQTRHGPPLCWIRPLVDVALKLLIDNIELVDKLFKLLKVVVDVALKLLIDNIELVDKLFKLLKKVVDLLFKLLIDVVLP